LAGFVSGRFLSFAVSGSNIIAGTDSGIYISSDGGSNWIRNSITTRAIISIIVNGGTTFAGGYGGVYRSSNNGTSWTKANNTGLSTGIQSLAMRGSNIFAGTYGEGVFISSDSGSTWISDSSGLSGNGLIITSLAFSDTTLFAGTYSGIWKYSYIPGKPKLLSPANNDSNQSVSPSLSWYATYLNNLMGQPTYTIQVSTVSNFASTIINKSAISNIYYNISGLSTNTTYFWRICATNTYGTSAWSDTWSFFVPPIATTPILISPISGAYNIAINNDTLSWNSTTNAATFRVQVSIIPSFSSTMVDDSAVVKKFKVINLLSSNSAYYWRVNATNAAGTSAWSNIWSFTTIPIPTVPILIAPANTATASVKNPTLYWNSSTGATSYSVQISTDSSFIISTKIVFNDSTIITTSKEIDTLNATTTYFWRVNATNTWGTSVWSSIWKFTTGTTTGVINVALANKDFFGIQGNRFRVNSGAYEISVFNLSGRLVYGRKAAVSTGFTGILPVKDNGVYIVSLKQGEKALVKMVQVVR